MSGSSTSLFAAGGMPTPERAFPPGVVGTQREVAEAFQHTYGRITLRQVQNWMQKGCPGDPQEGYNLLLIADWYRQNVDQVKASAKAVIAEKTQVELEERRARTQYLRMRIAKDAGRLVERRKVRDEWVTRILAVRTGLLALPRFTSQLAGRPREEIQAELDDIARALLDDYAAGRFADDAVAHLKLLERIAEGLADLVADGRQLPDDLSDSLQRYIRDKAPILDVEADDSPDELLTDAIA